ncbi:MAG: hypothetical protein ACOYNY_25535 [Caldilineaceae bacterium]|jgi:hypothetical protein
MIELYPANAILRFLADAVRKQMVYAGPASDKPSLAAAERRSL